MVLCYNKESGKLYHANSAPATDVLFNSYEDKGFKESEKINVAGTGFSFVIKSNFGYGNASYLLFKATYESNQLFDFETDCCNKNSLPFFSVPPTTKNWDKLFCKIEEVFSQRETWNVNSFTKFLIWFDSEYSNLNDEEIEKKPNFIMGKIITALYGRIPISLSANPLLEPYLIKMCKVGLKIVRKNITGSAFQKLSEENRKKGMDAIYMFLKYSNLEQLLFE